MRLRRVRKRHRERCGALNALRARLATKFDPGFFLLRGLESTKGAAAPLRAVVDPRTI